MEQKKEEFIRLHPSVLLLYFLGNTLITIFTWHPVLLAVSFGMAAVIGSFFIGRQIWKRICLLSIPLLFFSVVILPLFSHHGKTPLFYVNSQPVTGESICYGAAMSVMLVTVYLWLQIGSSVLDSEKTMVLFGSMLPSLGLLVSMVFRMLPLLRARFHEIHDAQIGLGMQTVENGLIRRVRILGKECSILVSQTLENSVETSLSMESRGYGTGRRTSFHLFTLHKRDVFFAVLLVFLFGLTLALIAAGSYQAYYFPQFSAEPIHWRQTIGIVTFVLGSLVPFWCGNEGRHG